MDQFKQTTRSLLRRRDIQDVLAASQSGGRRNHLSRSMGAASLTMLGVGNVIGTGIFFVFSITVPKAGPSVIISLLCVGVIAGLTALCYAEVASTVPVSGSAYSYALTTIGEFPAYLVGWCLMLEYGVGAAAVGVGWGDYLNTLLEGVFGWRIPEWLSSGPMSDSVVAGVINLPAVALVIGCAALLLRGIKESARITTILVIVKLSVLVMFAVIAFKGFSSDNLSPFAPNGFSGVTAAFPAIFFTYTGLEILATASEEVREPQKNIPRATGYAMLIISSMYLIVALAALGAQKWTAFAGQEAGLSKILLEVSSSKLPAIILAAGAVISVFSVALTSMYAQSRIMFAMARDGLLPSDLTKVNPRSLSPNRCVLITAVLASVMAAILPMEKLWDMISIGMVLAFLTVILTVFYLRRYMPDLKRGFSVPLYPWLPMGAAAACVWALTTIPLPTWFWFGSWATLATIVYFAYSRRHSTFGHRQHLDAEMLTDGELTAGG